MAKKTNTNQTVVEIPESPVNPVENPQQADLLVENNELKSINKELEATNNQLNDALKFVKTPEYLVVIPFKASESQGKEIYLAIRGWAKHFKEQFKIIVVGDEIVIPDVPEFNIPDNLSGIIHLPHDCSSENPPLDIISKLQEVLVAYPEYIGIILTNDDIYPVNDFDITEVKLLKSDGLLTDKKSIGNQYAENRERTLKCLQSANLPIFDYGCHTPVYLDTEKLIELIEKYNLTEKSHLLTSLYFNHFYPNRIPIKLELNHDNLKVGVYRSNADLHILGDIASRKIWISNSTTGWSSQLEIIISEILA